MAQGLTIGRVSQAAGIPAKTIRYYEAVGVLPRPGRSTNGYRQYTRRDVVRLQFIRRARAIGLPLEDLKALTAALDAGPGTAIRPRLAALVRTQLSSVDEQIADRRLLRRQLEEVLQGLQRESPARGADGCRCLDAVIVQPRLRAKEPLETARWTGPHRGDVARAPKRSR